MKRKKSVAEMAAQMKLWEAEGVPQREVVVRVAAWLCSEDEEEAELEAEMLRAEQAVMEERRIGRLLNKTEE